MTQNAHTTDPVLSQYLSRCLATVIVPLPPASENAGERLATELKSVRDEIVQALRDAGHNGIADDAAERVVQAVAAHGHMGPPSLVAVVRDDDVRLLPGPEAPRVHVSVGPLPALARLLAARQTWVPHAVVRLDRVGADVDVATAADHDDHLSVDGETQHIRKVNPGGWSQRRFQQRAEEQWQENVRLVADRLAQIAQAVDLQVIAVTGDENALSLLRSSLATDLAKLLQDLGTGGRGEDGSDDLVDDAADRLVRSVASDRQAATTRTVLDAVGSGAGASGRADVLEALFEARVDTLLVHVEPAGSEGEPTRFGYVGEGPNQVTADSSVLHGLDLPATRVPLADAALAGAAATGADVVVTLEPVDDVEDGIAASLRG